VQSLHCTHHYSSLMVSRYTTLVPSLGLGFHIGPAREAGLSAGIRWVHTRKKEEENAWNTDARCLCVTVGWSAAWLPALHD